MNIDTWLKIYMLKKDNTLLSFKVRNLRLLSLALLLINIAQMLYILH